MIRKTEITAYSEVDVTSLEEKASTVLLSPKNTTHVFTVGFWAGPLPVFLRVMRTSCGLPGDPPNPAGDAASKVNIGRWEARKVSFVTLV